MFEKIVDLFNDLNAKDSSEESLGDEQLRTAAAALLVHATIIDGTVESAEVQKLRELLCARFDLSAKEANHLIRKAELKEKEAVDLYGFTNVLTRSLDQNGRQKIVEMLWEIALADGVIHEFENNLVWRASELLGVSTNDRIRLRKLIEARLGLA